jgi:single-strand DNA-binding protein
MLNVLNATGNLGSDAEVRFTKDGAPVANFSFPLSSGYGDRKKTSWVRCSIIGKRAETLAPMLLKGTLVAITAEIFLNEYSSKDGTIKSNLEALVSNVALLGKRDDSRGSSNTPKKEVTESFDDIESDIPF